MRTARGFSLIEIVVSIFIVSVMLLLLQAVMRSASLARVSNNQGVALSIVQNKIEGLRTGGYDNIPVSGSFSDSILSTLPSASGTITTSDYDEDTKQVTVNVQWQEPDSTNPNTVSISTLITQAGGLP